jgi:hypothetical protein
VVRCDLARDHRALRLRLRQPGTRNLDALGATAFVRALGVTQRRVVSTGGSYLSQGEFVLTFGLGTEAKGEVTVVWPDGTEQRVGTLAARAEPHLVERR